MREQKLTDILKVFLCEVTEKKMQLKSVKWTTATQNCCCCCFRCLSSWIHSDGLSETGSVHILDTFSPQNTFCESRLCTLWKTEDIHRFYVFCICGVGGCQKNIMYKSCTKSILVLVYRGTQTASRFVYAHLDSVYICLSEKERWCLSLCKTHR